MRKRVRARVRPYNRPLDDPERPGSPRIDGLVHRYLWSDEATACGLPLNTGSRDLSWHTTSYDVEVTCGRCGFLTDEEVA